MSNSNSHVGARTSWVDVGQGTRAFLSLPGSLTAPLGAVVVGHPPGGPLQPALNLTARFASHGYVAIAPEVAPLPDDQVAECMARGVDYVERLPEVDARRIVALGVGASAGYPHLLNSVRPDLAASLLLYGGTRPSDAVVRALTAPTFGIFGEADAVVPVAEVQALRSKLEEHRKGYEIHLFPGASQGWFEDHEPGSAAEAAWSELLTFLEALSAGAFPPNRVRWRWLPHGLPESPG